MVIFYWLVDFGEGFSQWRNLLAFLFCLIGINGYLLIVGVVENGIEISRALRVESESYRREEEGV